jgi:hypothetical protein
MNRIPYFLIAGFSFVFAGCDFSPTGVRLKTGLAAQTESEATIVGTKSVTVSWDANRERAVNSVGGGYRVYFSRNGVFDAITPFVTAAFTTGTTPTAAALTGLASGTYTIRVVAFSAANPAGSVGTQTTVAIP